MGEEGLDMDALMGEEGEVERIKTYVEGLDDKIGGGIPKGHIVLIAGTAGTMKSSLCYNILYHNALKNGMKGLYITLEQNRSSLTKHMAGLGMPLSRVEENLNIWDLGIIRTSLIAGETWLAILEKDIGEYKEKVGLDLLVIDSLPVLALISNLKDPRTELFHFFEWLRELEVTTLLISEMSEGTRIYGKYEEDFLADTIVYLSMYEVDEVTVQRRIRFVKMRNSNHSMNYYTLLFENDRFQVTRLISQTMLE